MKVIKSRNKREGYFWHGLNEHDVFKMRMHEQGTDRTSLRRYGRWLRKQLELERISNGP